MALANLAIIGESINDSVPRPSSSSTRGDLPGIIELARSQEQGGAAYIDVNVGARPPEFMAELVRKIQQVTRKPLSIDTPDPDIARAGLEAYDPRQAGGAKPLLNSISAVRLEMFELAAARPFRPILLVSEKMEDGQRMACRTAEETYQAAKVLVAAARASGRGFSNDDFVIDPGIAPVGSDSEGNLKRLLGESGADPRRQGLCRLPCLGGTEQLHRDAAAEAGQRRAGQRPLGERLPRPGPCPWAWTWSSAR